MTETPATRWDDPHQTVMVFGCHTRGAGRVAPGTRRMKLWRGAFDPAATITIDKLPGAFVPQALSARIFGFRPWSLALPQVAEGVVTVLVMYRAVRQWAGEVPGLLAALLLTLTPVAASVFGHPMEDGALMMCLVLAADAWQRAVTTGRLRSLVLSGVWVGLGFQAKMLQAWMILPALFIGYQSAPGALAFRPVVRGLRPVRAAQEGRFCCSMYWRSTVRGAPPADPAK